jgi:hypothetical protein
VLVDIAFDLGLVFANRTVAELRNDIHSCIEGSPSLQTNPRYHGLWLSIQKGQRPRHTASANAPNDHPVLSAATVAGVVPPPSLHNAATPSSQSSNVPLDLSAPPASAYDNTPSEPILTTQPSRWKRSRPVLWKTDDSQGEHLPKINGALKSSKRQCCVSERRTSRTF